MIHGRELVKSRYSVDSLVCFYNRSVLEGRCVPEDVFNPLYMLGPGSEQEIVRSQIEWQLTGDQELLEFRIQQVGRKSCSTGLYTNGSLSNLFLYSRFDKVDLEAMLAFLGGPYLDSCYISEQGGKCTLKSQAGHTQLVGTSLEHTAGIIGKLVGLVVVNSRVTVSLPIARVGDYHVNPLTTKEKPYLFHGVPSQFKNAPPLPE